MEKHLSVLLSLSCFMFLTMILRLLYSIWWKPKMIEKCLKGQGIHGPPYRLFYGNFKEMSKMAKEAASKPMKFTHDVMPRLNPFLQKNMLIYGKLFVIWLGTAPRVVVMEPKLIKEILNDKSGDFEKPQIHPLKTLFVTGLASYDGEKWAKHRKIINPAFHIEKLKGMLPAFSICCDEMIEKWEKLVGLEGSCELDVSLEFQKLTADAISRAAFGSSFEQGRQIFQLQKEQCKLYMDSYYMTAYPWLRSKAAVSFAEKITLDPFQKTRKDS
ncbi:hypothetical protein L1049_009745 [Liquidambar formosana]|uniref:Cytochrome P450 n=1 Tax=Liquidambar formosana TaxID=63359 RepID=A0AAP0N8J4_LIQFO